MSNFQQYVGPDTRVYGSLDLTAVPGYVYDFGTLPVPGDGRWATSAGPATGIFDNTIVPGSPGSGGVSPTNRVYVYPGVFVDSSTLPLGNGTFVQLGPSISSDSTGATDALNIQALMDSAAAGGGTVRLDQPGTYRVNLPVFKHYNVKLFIGPATTLKAVGSFPAGSDLLQDAPPTTVAVGSNGQTTSATTLNVASTTGYPTSGQILASVGGSAIATIGYTGKTATSFTGCSFVSGSTGTYSTGNAVSTVARLDAVYGGGTLDSNNLARHTLWAHRFAGLFLDVVCQNALQDDVILGDTGSVSTSYQAVLSSRFLVNRTAGNYPLGYRALWITSACSDGVVDKSVIKGQQVGIQCDGGDWTFDSPHAWAPLDGVGNGMNTCFYDNGIGNQWNNPIADTPMTYGILLGSSQNYGRFFMHKVYLNGQQGTDDTVVAVQNNGTGQTNTFLGGLNQGASATKLHRDYVGDRGQSTFLGMVNVNVTATAIGPSLVTSTGSGSALGLQGDNGSGQDILPIYLNVTSAGGTKVARVDRKGNWRTSSAGVGFATAEGSNAKQGVATLVAGTVTVANTSVTATSRIFLTAQDGNTTGALRVSARTAGTSFVITSSNAADTGVVAYEMFEVG